MKKLLSIITIILFLLFPYRNVFAALNTHSMDFEKGSSQYAYTADEADLDITGDLTMAAWVRVETAPNEASHGVLGKWGVQAAEKSYLMSYSEYDADGGTPKLYVGIYGDSTESQNGLAHNLGTETWVHIAMAYDASAGEVEYCINGSSIGTKSGIPNSIQNTASAFTIGTHRVVSGAHWDGEIDDVRIYAEDKTCTSIASDYQEQLNGNESNLKAYWMLNNNAEDKGEVTDPAGSAANDLTLVNTPVYSTDVPFVGTAPPPAVEEVQSEFWFK